MSTPIPHFELRRIYDDGTESEPLLFPLRELADTLASSRRGFLAAGLTAGAVLGNFPQPVNAAAPSPVSPRSLPRAHDGLIRSLSISSDGQRLATVAADDFKLWSLADKQIEMHRKNTTNQPFRAAVLARQLAVLAVATSKGQVVVYDPPTKVVATDAQSITYGLSSLFAADDASLFAGTAQGGLVRWSLPDLKYLDTQRKHTTPITAIAASQDGQWLATGDENGIIRLWSRKDMSVAAEMPDHGKRVTHLDFKPDGSQLMSRGNDNTIRLWRLPDGALHRTLKDEWSKAETMTLAPNGRFLITSAQATLSIWRIPSGESLGTLQGHLAPVTCVAISPDSSWAASGDQAGVVILWNLRDRRPESYLFDPEASAQGDVGSSFDVVSGTRTVRMTLPCGTPLPPNAVCTCNCVPGRLELVRLPTTITTPSVATPNVTNEARSQHAEELRRRREEYELQKQELAEQRRIERMEQLERRRGTNTVPYNYPVPVPSGGGTLICTCDLIYICHARQLASPLLAARRLARNLLLSGGTRAMEYLAWAHDAFDGGLRDSIAKVQVALKLGRQPTPAWWPAATLCQDWLENADEVLATMAAQCLALGHHQLSPAAAAQVTCLLDSARQRPWQVRYLGEALSRSAAPRQGGS